VIFEASVGGVIALQIKVVTLFEEAELPIDVTVDGKSISVND
jgi:hypothetical protein